MRRNMLFMEGWQEARLTSSCAHRKPDLGELLLCAGAGIYLAAAVPDAIEPAAHPNRRRFGSTVSPWISDGCFDFRY